MPNRWFELLSTEFERIARSEELKETQVNKTLQLPGAWEAAGAIARSMSEMVRFGLPEDYFQTDPNKVRSLTQPQLAAVAQIVIHPDKLIWVIVRDRARIEAGIRGLNMGDLHLLDVDGPPVK